MTMASSFDQLPRFFSYLPHYLYDQLLLPLSSPSQITPITVLGSLTALYLAKKTLDIALLFLWPSSLPQSLHPTRQPYLTYALVTGASDGIGRSLAFELSRRGFALVLHGRNPAKLGAMADEIQAAHGAKGAPRPLLLIAQADRCSTIDFKKLVEPLQKLRLTVLVNNVGAQGHLAPDPFHTLDWFSREDVERLVDLNAMFMTHLTCELTPLLLKASDPAVSDDAWTYPVPLTQRAPKGRAPTAYILNASSAAAMGIPYVPVYAASKGYVEALSASLRNEFAAEHYPASRIGVLALRIGNVVTTTNPGVARLFMPTADTYAKAILDRVGCGAPLVVPYFWHWLQVAVFTSLPQAAVDLGFISNMRWKLQDFAREKAAEAEELAQKKGK